MADWYVSSAAYAAIAAFVPSAAYTVGQIVKPTAPAFSAQILQTGRPNPPRQLARFPRRLAPDRRVLTKLVFSEFEPYDLTGQQLVSLLVPFGTPLQATGDVELVGRVVGSRTAAISNLYQGRQSGKLLVRVAVPVQADRTLRYVLAASIDPASLTELLTQASLPTGSLVGLIDRNYVIVARSRAAEQFVGQPATPDFVAQASRMNQGFFRAQIF